MGRKLRMTYSRRWKTNWALNIIMSTYHPQSNDILEKFNSLLKTCIKNTVTVNLTGKIQCDFPSLVSGYIWLSTLKKVLFIFPFGRDPLTPLQKLLSPKIRHPGDERGLLDLEEVRYALTIARKNICLSRQRSNKDHTSIRSPDKFKVTDLVYIKNMPHPLGNPNGKVVFI